MKIIHTADWHIGKMLNDYSLIDDQKYYFGRFIERLEILKPDALLVAGDLYDRSVPSAQAVSLLNYILSEIVLRLNIKTFIVSGNHDSKERLAFGSELLSKCGLYIAGGLSKEVYSASLSDDKNSVNIYMMPYIEPYSVRSLYKDSAVKTHDEAVKLYCKEMLLNLDKSKTNILISHGLFGWTNKNEDEISVGGADMVDSSIFSEFDYVALGHLHSPRTAGSDKMVYSGSPLKYSVDEAGQKKSFSMLEINGKEITVIKEEITPLRDVRIIEGSYEFLTNRDNHSGLDDYVFANITDDEIMLDAISRLRSIFPNILGLKYTNLNSQSAEGSLQSMTDISQKTEQQLFSSFYEGAVGKPLQKDQLEYVSEIMSQVKGNTPQE